MPQSHQKNDSARLNFYFFPSPHGTDWSSPATLALSALKNRFSFLPRPLHSLGHVNIEGVNSAGERQFLTGMITEDTAGQLRLVLREDYGLGILFHSFLGKLEHPDEVEAQFEPRFKTDKISLLSLKVSDATVKRAVDYLNAYVDECGYHSYGLVNRPLHLEGAGCSAFAASFLEVTGLDHDEFRKHWAQTVRIHDQHLGGGHSKEGLIKVPFLKLIREAKRWAHEHEPHRKLFFWDPDLMHTWLERVWREIQGGREIFPGQAQRAYKIGKSGKAKAVEIDFTGAPLKAVEPEIRFHAKPSESPNLAEARKVRDHQKKIQASHQGKKSTHHL